MSFPALNHHHRDKNNTSKYFTEQCIQRKRTQSLKILSQPQIFKGPFQPKLFCESVTFKQTTNKTLKKPHPKNPHTTPPHQQKPTPTETTKPI